MMNMEFIESEWMDWIRFVGGDMRGHGIKWADVREIQIRITHVGGWPFCLSLSFPFLFLQFSASALRSCSSTS